MVSGLLVARRVLRHRLGFCAVSNSSDKIESDGEPHTFRCPETDNVQSIVDWLTRHYFTAKYEYFGTQD